MPRGWNPEFVAAKPIHLADKLSANSSNIFPLLCPKAEHVTKNGQERRPACFLFYTFYTQSFPDSNKSSISSAWMAQLPAEGQISSWIVSCNQCGTTQEPSAAKKEVYRICLKEKITVSKFHKVSGKLLQRELQRKKGEGRSLKIHTLKNKVPWVPLIKKNCPECAVNLLHAATQ